MSIYTALSFDIPVIAYCALHQVRKGTKREDYQKTMADLHRLVRVETEAVNAAWRKYQSEASAHILQTQQSLLSEFLSTPLTSDREEIQNILKNQLVEYSKRVLPNHRFGVVTATEGRVMVNSVGEGGFNKLARSGKKYMTELGFRTTKGHPEIYESMFVFEGGQNFDIIEHMIRDRVGIYTPVHGKHIKEFDSYAYAAYNLVYLSGDLDSHGKFEASLFFSKGETQYAPFRNALREMLDLSQANRPFPHVSVWQRKLGLGAGREFVLRIRSSDVKNIASFLAKIPTVERKQFASQALNKGHLLLKEMIIG